MRHPLINRAIFVLALVGLLIAGALWYWHSHPADIPCGGTGGCETVASSPYSRLPVGTGPPIAMYGTLGYLAILVLTFLRTLPSVGEAPRRDTLASRLVLLGAVIGTAFSARLTYMEINPEYIGAICKWCMASQVLILLILVLSITDVMQTSRGQAATSAEPKGIDK